MKLTPKGMKKAAVILCVSGFLVLVATFFKLLLPVAKKATWIVFALAALVSITEGFPPRKSFWSRYPLWVPFWLKIIDAVMALLAFLYVSTSPMYMSPEEQESKAVSRFVAFLAINVSIRSAAYWHTKESCNILIDPWNHSSSPETLDERLDAIRDEHFPSLSQKRK